MVLKRAWPCSSRLVPVGAPIGFSGALSRVGARVFSAQSFSDADGLRPSNTSETGLSAMILPRSDFGLFSGISFPVLTLMIEEQSSRCKRRDRPSGWWPKSKSSPQGTPFGFAHGRLRDTEKNQRPLDACFLRH